MLTCIIIDDEPHAITVLEEYIDKTPFLEYQGSFRNPLDAIEFINTQPIDLLFLDINMPHINGIKLADTIQVKPLLIFTTAYSQYAVKSYELNAIDYLLKPIQFDRFLTAVAKSVKHAKKETVQNNEMIIDHIFLKSGPEIHKVLFKELVFLEKDKHYIIVHLLKKKIIVRMNFSTFMQLIPNDRFVQIHKSFIISLDFLDLIESQHLILAGKKLPIGRYYRETFLKRINLKQT